MEFKLKNFEKVIEVTRIANIHYFEFTAEYHTFKDKHAFRELVYMDSGSITVEAENYSGVLEKNQLIIHRANEIHSLSCSRSTAPNVIIIGFECQDPQLDVFSTKPYALNNEQQALLTEIIKEGRNVFLPPYNVPNLTDMKKRNNYPFGSDQMIKLKLEEFFINLVRGHEVKEKNYPHTINDLKMLEIIGYIDTNFTQRINLDELCFLFGTNKTTLCSHFKNEVGETIINYINHKKIKEAKKLLREGNYNLTQIASMVGFSSIHYFSRIFKKYENKSTTEYINTIKSRLML